MDSIMVTFENLPTELIAEIALMCRYPAIILRLMITSKALYAALYDQYKCKDALLQARRFRNVIDNINLYIIHASSSPGISQIDFRHNMTVVTTFMYTVSYIKNGFCLVSNKHIRGSNGNIKTTITIFDYKFNGNNHITNITRFNI